MRQKPDLKSLSDAELLRRLTELAQHSRRVEAELIAHIAEVDERRLYAREAMPSMFAYCREVLHLSEPEAYLRIAVARASRQHPMLLTMLADGRLHLSGIERLAPHLTRDNRETLLNRATHKSKRQVEELVAELQPRPDVRAAMRRLPERRRLAQPTPALQLRPDGVAPTSAELRLDGAQSAPRPVPARPAAVEPLAPARYKVCFTASAGLRDKLERLQALMRSSVPDGDLAKIIDLAVTEKLERLETKRFANTKTPRKSFAETDTTPTSRHIPAAVRRAVHERDGGRCTYQDKGGKRCSKRDDLEFHHRNPFGRGGDHSPTNLSMTCKAHNALLAEDDYGKEKMARFRRSASRVSERAVVYSGGHRTTGSRARPSP